MQKENINRLCQKVSATRFLAVIVRHYRSQLTKFLCMKQCNF